MNDIASIVGTVLLCLGACSLYLIAWYKLASHCVECIKYHHNCEAVAFISVLMLYTGAALIFAESVI